MLFYQMVKMFSNVCISLSVSSTLWVKKRATFFDYNAPVPWSIFVIFIPLKTINEYYTKRYKMYNFTLTVPPQHKSSRSLPAVCSVKPVVRFFFTIFPKLYCAVTVIFELTFLIIIEYGR